MKLTITVTGKPSPNSIQCKADLEVMSFDEQAVSRLVHAAQQCDAVVRQASMSGVSERDKKPAPQTGYGGQQQTGPRLATDKQVAAIHNMAKRQSIDLSPILHDEFSVSAASALSIRQASELIDRLKGNLLSA